MQEDELNYFVVCIEFDKSTSKTSIERLIRVLKTFEYWCRISPNSYIVAQNGYPSDVFNRLKPSLGGMDHMTVFRIEKRYAAKHNQQTLDWLAKHFPKSQ
jgi:hypothetical protein